MEEWLVDDGTTQMLQRATTLAVLCEIEKQGNMEMYGCCPMTETVESDERK
jgi:hypothetical protein